MLAALFALTSGDLGGEGMQTIAPEAPELRQPVVYFLKWSGVDGINAAGTVRAHPCEAVFAQYLQVLRDGSLRDAEFLLDCVDDRSGSVFAGGEQFENAPPYRIAENVKGMH